MLPPGWASPEPGRKPGMLGTRTGERKQIRAPRRDAAPQGRVPGLGLRVLPSQGDRETTQMVSRGKSITRAGWDLENRGVDSRGTPDHGRPPGCPATSARLLMCACSCTCLRETYKAHGVPAPTLCSCSRANQQAGLLVSSVFRTLSHWLYCGSEFPV